MPPVCFLLHIAIFAAAGHRLLLETDGSLFTIAHNESLIVAERQRSSFQDESLPENPGDLPAPSSQNKATERKERMTKSRTGSTGTRKKSKKFGAAALALEGNFLKKRAPRKKGNDACAKEEVCHSYIAKLKEKEGCPTRMEKQFMGNIRRAMLGEDRAGTVSDAVQAIKKKLTGFHVMRNPNPMTLEQADELLQHPDGRYWELIMSEKATAEEWCKGDATIAVEIPATLDTAPGPVTPSVSNRQDIDGPTQQAQSLFTAQQLFQRHASIEVHQDGVPRVEKGTLAKLVQANPAVDQPKKTTKKNIQKKKKKGPKPYGLAALPGKLEQNVAILLRKLDFALKSNTSTNKWPDYATLFKKLVSSNALIIGEGDNKQSATVAETMLSVMNEIPNDLLDAAAADDVLKMENQHELEKAAPGGLRSSAAFLRAWVTYRATDPFKALKCVMSRFDVAGEIAEAQKVVTKVKKYYPIFKRFSRYMSDAVSRYVVAFSSAEIDFLESENETATNAMKDYSGMQDNIFKFSTVKGLKDNDANKKHPLAAAALPLLLIANVFNKGNFRLRATVPSDARWKPSFLDTFLYFAARTSKNDITLLDKMITLCNSLATKAAPDWPTSIGNMLQALTSLSKQLEECQHVNLPRGETSFVDYHRSVVDVIGLLTEAHQLLVDALGPVYLSLLPETIYNTSVPNLDMSKLSPKIVLWQKKIISSADKTIPHPQPFVSLFDDFTIRSNAYTFCRNVASSAEFASTDHFHVAS